MLFISKKIMFHHSKKNESKDSQSGLTLIECLVAIVVTALTVSAVAPVAIFSVATRVRNQRTEQALQLAQGELDKIRLTIEQGGDYTARLTELNLMVSPASTAVNVAAPSRFRAYSESIDSFTDARKIDSDNDGDSDFAVQLFRTAGIVDTTSTPVAFEVGVRVYDARAEDNVASLLTDSSSLGFTSGEGDVNRRPLAVLYTQVTQGDRAGALCHYWERSTGSSPTTLQCS
ncbi:MAG: prepilin-type N-terminal cleavage/methylation domain-containing protein [Cyanobacteria bacterium J06560_6]